MTTIATLLLFIALVGYGLKEYYQVKLKSSPHSTPIIIQDQIADLLMDFSHTGRLADLGSGWGGMVLNLAKQMPEWQIDGIEQSPTPWVISNCRSTGKTFGNYRFFIGPMQRFHLKNYDVIYLNAPRETMNIMLPRLVRALQDDTLIITYPHPLPRIPNPDVITVDNHRIYLYRGIDAYATIERHRAERLAAQQQAPTETKPIIEQPVAAQTATPEPDEQPVDHPVPTQTEQTQVPDYSDFYTEPQTNPTPVQTSLSLDKTD
jgi:hypothetical protein